MYADWCQDWNLYLGFISKFAFRNTKKSEDKVEMLEKEIVETKEKEEKLREDYKKVEENAGIVMKEHEDLQVVK